MTPPRSDDKLASMSHGDYKVISDRVTLQLSLRNARPEVGATGRLEWNGDNLRHVHGSYVVDMGRIESLAVVRPPFDVWPVVARVALIAGCFVFIMAAAGRVDGENIVPVVVSGLAIGLVMSGLLLLMGIFTGAWVRVRFARLDGQSGETYLYDKKGNWTGGSRWLYKALLKVQSGEARNNWPKDWNWLADAIFAGVVGVGCITIAIWTRWSPGMKAAQTVSKQNTMVGIGIAFAVVGVLLLLLMAVVLIKKLKAKS